MNASETINQVLLACLPPDVPISFQRIVSAHFVGSGRKRVAVGHLIMFDGQPATVEVFSGGAVLGIPISGHRWTEMPGGACSWEGDRWVRCDEDGNILPAQGSLVLGDAA